MAEKENSAFRLYRFVQKMVEQKTSLPTAQVLVSTFGTRTDANAQKQNAALAKVMFLLFDELDSLVSELKQHNYTKETIDSITAPFDRLSAVGLAQPWPQNREKFSASLPVLRSVGDSPNVLSEDAAAINNDELTELSKSVEELRQEVETSELPLQVKQFIFQQLDLISDAIRECPKRRQNAQFFMR